MQLEEWQSKLQARGIASESLKAFRARVCRINGYNSVADIPLEKADDLIESIAELIDSELEELKYF